MNKVECVYKKYYGLMMYIAGEYLSNQQDREDVVHDSMVKIIRNLEKIDISDTFRTKSFCVTVVKHAAIDFLRKNGNNYVSLDEDFKCEDNSEDLINAVLLNEAYRAALKAIDNLSDTYKNVCKLKYINGLKEREIAEVLSLPLKTVSLRIYRGKQILRDAIRKEQGND